jgi:hypothetical protein
MSKLNMLLLLFPFVLPLLLPLKVPPGVAADVDDDASGEGNESNVDAKDMNIGLLAMVVYGAFDESPVLAPKPKSICMAPAVAVGCGMVSSRRLSMEGSKDVIELQSRGLVPFGGDAAEDDGVEAEVRAECGAGEGTWEKVSRRGDSAGAVADLGIEKVKEPCLRAMFSV